MNFNEELELLFRQESLRTLGIQINPYLQFQVTGFKTVAMEEVSYSLQCMPMDLFFQPSTRGLILENGLHEREREYGVGN